MKKYLTLSIIIAISISVNAQIDSSLLKSGDKKDTVKRSLTMDAIYNRPFLNIDKSPVSIGGYIEANWQYVSTWHYSG